MILNFKCVNINASNYWLGFIPNPEFIIISFKHQSIKFRFRFHKFIKNLRWNQIVNFDIPCDPFTEVITNLCLNIDLGLICPSNFLILCLLGFLSSRVLGSCGYLDQNTHFKCVFWCLTFVLIKQVSHLAILVPHVLFWSNEAISHH